MKKGSPLSKTRQSLLHQFFLKLWYQQSLTSRLLSLCLLPLASVYQSIARSRRRHQSQRAKALSVPVVIVGNITVGGTGKTPVVIALAAALKAHNIQVGIISRGYGGSHDQSERVKPLLVSPQTSVTISGDEALLIAKETLCSVVISRNRREAAEYLLSITPQLDVIISDDGLQHYQLYRSLEIVVVDNKRGLGNQYCLPAGPLREPIERLEDVDWVLFNTQIDDTCDSTRQLITAVLPTIQCQRASVCLKPNSWLNVGLQTCHELDEPTWLKAHRATSQPLVTAIAAIGNPQRFFDTVARLGIVANDLAFDDHHGYAADDFEADADNIVLMTSKDAVKCASFANKYVWALNVSLQLPQALIDDVLNVIGKPHKAASTKNSPIKN
jgi:tetraacyldisaccharide 4'-kinase